MQVTKKTNKVCLDFSKKSKKEILFMLSQLSKADLELKKMGYSIKVKKTKK